MTRVVIVGGGWAGCSAALAARQAGAGEVVVLERTDSLLGTGLVGGIMRNNGRYTAAEEMIALGAGRLFEICDATSLHHGVDFPGHEHASLYDVALIEPAVRRCLLENGVEIWLMSRVTGIERGDTSLAAIQLENGTAIPGDVFIDTTGTVGSQSFCTENGNGCVMCIVRCPTFGPRVSLAGLDRMSAEEYTCVHGGYDNRHVRADPNRTVPLDVLREWEKRGRIGRLHEVLWSTVGNVMPVEWARQRGREVAQELRDAGIQAVILTAT